MRLRNPFRRRRTEDRIFIPMQPLSGSLFSEFVDSDHDFLTALAILRSMTGTNRWSDDMPRVPITFVLGCTGAGKTSFIERCLESYPDMRGVFVGRALVAKYGAGFFDQMAAPEIESEAMNLMEEGIEKAIVENAKGILIDGQPRSIGQVAAVGNLYSRNRIEKPGLISNRFYYRFLVLHCSEEMRSERASLDADADPERYELRMRRITRDMVDMYGTMVALMLAGWEIDVWDTENSGNPISLDMLAKKIRYNEPL